MPADANALHAPTLEHLFGLNFPERKYLVKPWLRQGESALIWSPPGQGKSMLALSLALLVAGGGELMGWQAPEPHKVLLVDGEQHIEDIIDRARMLIGTVYGIDAERAAKNIKIAARQAQHLDFEFPDLAESAGRRLLFDKITKGKHDLVILDNFSTLATVSDENAAAAFDPVLRFLLRLKQANVATILVHHSNKTGRDFRGSSKLATTFEVIMGLRKPTGDMQTNGTHFDMEWTKYRQLRDDTVKGRSAWLSKDEDTGAVSWEYTLSEEEEADELIRLVRSLKHSTQDGLAKELGMSTGKLSKLKQRAIYELKLITKTEWEGAMEAARELRNELVSDF